MIDRDGFERRYGDDWRQLERLLAIAEAGKKEAALAHLPELYRRCCGHLSLARARGYGSKLERRLHALVLRGHQVLYRPQRSGGRQWLHLLAVEFPTCVRQHARTFWLATALLYLPLLVAFGAVIRHPEFAHSLVDAETLRGYEAMYGDDGATAGRDSDADVYMFGYYIYNNISIAFRTFASGIVYGLGTIFFLVLNGVMIGTVAAHLQLAGLGETFYSFVVGHSALEITAITIAGVAGLQLGGSLVSPGDRTRVRSLREAARRVLPLVYGAALFLVLAAVIEAFWSSSTAPAALRFAVGGLLWVGVALFLGLAGRGRAA